MERVRNASRPNAAVKAAKAGVPAPSTAVIGESELQKLYDIVDKRSQVEAQDQRDRRAELKSISEARVSHWPNTIEAQRIKKEKARKERLDEEEARRKVIDEQEAALQEAKKEQAVRKANLLLFEQNDRIKNFSSKLFLSTVLDEREKQLAIKDEKKALAAQAEARWAVIQAEQLREAEEKEVQKLKAMDERTVGLKRAQLDQLSEIRTRKIAARDQDMKEGHEIKRHAQIAVQEEQEAEQQRKIKQKETAAELIRANEEQRRIREERLQKEKEEEEKIFQFAKLKEDQMQERKKRVDEKFHAKLDRRQNLINRQSELLAELKAATEEREMKMMRDFDKERREREAREQAKRDARQKEIDDFQNAQAARKARAKEKEEAEKLKMQEVWRGHAERLIDEELDERKAARERAERHQQFLLMQDHEKKMQKAHEKRSEFEEGLALQKAMAEEQEMYESYVNTVMHDYVTRGRQSDIVQNAARRTNKMKNTA